jgi:alpha-beta hydrolase superfamily lysophospholipase
MNFKRIKLMKHHEGELQGAGKLWLYYQCWHPLEETLKGVVAIVHGLGSHSSLFGNIINALVPRGYAVYGLDLRGHGRSQGQRGHIAHWSEFREDIHVFLKMIETYENNSPPFLLGHSLGGLIALDYAIRLPSSIQGIITMAPPLGRIGVSPLKLTLGKTISQVIPRLAINVGLVESSLSRDQNVLASISQDPLMHSRASARLAREFLVVNNWVHAHVADLQVPILMLHGGADRVSLPESSRLFFQQIQFSDKEHYEYPDSRHALHRDLDYPQIVADLGNWLDRHSPERTLVPFRRQSLSSQYRSA